MRTFISVWAALCVGSALAFDSAEWLVKRELLTREAERLAHAYTNCTQNLQTPAQDVTIPVETFADGSVKVLVVAKKAQYFLDKGLIWAQEVVVKRFRPDRTVEALVEAKNCVVDRQTRSGWADGAAAVTHGNTTFRGRGVYFSSPESYVRVFADADIDTADLKFGEVRP